MAVSESPPLPDMVIKMSPLSLPPSKIITGTIRKLSGAVFKGAGNLSKGAGRFVLAGKSDLPFCTALILLCGMARS